MAVVVYASLLMGSRGTLGRLHGNPIRALTRGL